MLANTLSYACRYGHVQILEYFLEKNEGKMTNFSRSAAVACDYDNLEIAKILITRHAKTEPFDLSWTKQPEKLLDIGLNISYLKNNKVFIDIRDEKMINIDSELTWFLIDDLLWIIIGYSLWVIN